MAARKKEARQKKIRLMEADSFLLRAPVVVPVARPPIDEGAVFISGDRICDVGTGYELLARYPDVRTIDLASQILLPGLINAHCHLDYTRMAGGITPKKSFSDWIKAILAYKSDWSYTDFAESWMAGAHMLLRNGTTTVLDIEGGTRTTARRVVGHSITRHLGDRDDRHPERTRTGFDHR